MLFSNESPAPHSIECLEHSIFTNHTINLTLKNKETINKAIEAKAQAQFHHGADMEKQVIAAKIINPSGAGTWNLMNQYPQDPVYLRGFVELFDIEIGSYTKSELEITLGSMVCVLREIYNLRR